jgi:2-dehydro-3-deoxyphosphogluconate aldolase/(4S)-4-hydroxy-2-oxoglutarate aldolase
VSTPHRAAVAAAIANAPIVGVVRTSTPEEAARIAATMIDSGLQLIEITFTVPGATDLVRRLLAERQGDGPPWIGMGTVTDTDRAERAVVAGAEFVVTPNADPAVAAVATAAGRYLIVGALTCTEIAAARAMGADLVKVYPLPPVGGPAYLETVRQPLGDIPMLAAGGFGVDEIPAYRAAGAVAFGIGAPLIGAGAEDAHGRIARALALARGVEAS